VYSGEVDNYPTSSYIASRSARLIVSPTNAPTREFCGTAVGMPNDGEPVEFEVEFEEEVVEFVAFEQATLEDILKLLSNVTSAH